MYHTRRSPAKEGMTQHAGYIGTKACIPQEKSL